MDSDTRQFRAELSTQIFFGGFILLFASVLNSPSQVRVEVSPQYSAISYSNARSIAPDEAETFELPHPPLKDRYKLTYSVTGGTLDVVAFDRMNVDKQDPNPVFLIHTPVSGSSSLSLPLDPSNDGLVVSLFNTSRLPITLDYVAFRVGVRPPSVTAQLKHAIEIPIIAMNKFYRLPKFKVVVVPCGSVNAFSSPDVTICSELIADLYEKDLTGASVLSPFGKRSRYSHRGLCFFQKDLW